MTDSIFKKYSGVFVGLGILALVFILRGSCLAVAKIGWDECMYLIQGDNILHGGIPYQDIWDNKGTALYFLFALIIKLTGHSVFGLRVFTALWISVSAYVMYLIGNRLYNKKCGILAALFFIVATSNFRLWAIESNTEIFITLPILIVVYNIFSLPLNNARLLVCGFLCGLAFHIKTISVFDTTPILLFIIFGKTYYKTDLPGIIKALLIFSIGFLIPSLVIFYYFWCNGYLKGFWVTYFIDPYRYVAFDFNIFQIIGQMLRQLRDLFYKIPVLCILPLAGLICPYSRNRKTAFFALWLFFIFLGIMAHHRFWPHVWIEAIPAFSLLSAMACVWLLSLRPRIIISTLIYLGIIVGLSWTVQDNLNQFKYKILQGHQYPPESALEASHYLNPLLKASDTLFIANAPLIIYFLTDKRVPSRYFYTDIFDEPDIYRRSIGIDPGQELRKIFYNNPTYIITKNSYNIYRPADYNEFIDHYLRKNYVLVKRTNTIRIYKYKFIR